MIFFTWAKAKASGGIQVEKSLNWGIGQREVLYSIHKKRRITLLLYAAVVEAWQLASRRHDTVRELTFCSQWHCATKRFDAGASVGTYPPRMPRTIFPLLFILFPLVLYFLWPSWPDLVDSIIAWGREHPLVWTPLIRMYLGHLESLVKTTKPYPQFEEVCSLFSLLLIDTKDEKTD